MSMPCRPKGDRCEVRRARRIIRRAHRNILGLLVIFVLGLLSGLDGRAISSPRSPSENPYSAIAARSPKEHPPWPPAYPFLLPLMEQGRLDLSVAERLPRLGIDEALALAKGARLGGDCLELPSLDGPPEPDSLDVLHYDIDIAVVDETARYLSATTTVRLRALASLTALDLDLVDSGVTGVEVRGDSAGSFAPIPFDHDGKELHVGPFSAVPADSVIEVRVHYEGTDHSCLSQGGPYSGLVFAGENVHTFSEPAYARYWYPCHDVPWDKATTTLAVTPPAGRVPSASGIFLGIFDLEGRSVWKWSTPEPVSTYLNAFYLSNYVTLEDSAGSIPLEYFVYPELADEAVVDFANVPDMMEFFSSFYPYPNPRYAMSLGFFGGGMEHQMNSLIGRFYIRGDRSSELLVSHELAHQWWGNLLTMATWREIWLNEGFATYFERLDLEHRYGWEVMRAWTARIDSLYEARLDPFDHPILEPPLTNAFSFVVYQKGARVLDMLRGVSRLHLMSGTARPPEDWAESAQAGEVRFFSIFGEYASRHAHGNVTTADFQAVAEAALEEDLDWFFDPWLRGLAFPRLALDWNATSTSDGALMEVAVRQVQESPTRFTMPLHVRYRSETQVLDEVRELTPDGADWIVALPVGDWTLEIDPDDWLLESTRPATLIPALRLLHVEPNPSTSGFILTAAQEEPVPTLVAFSIHDLQGRRVRSIDLGLVAPGPITLQWDGTAEDGTPVAPGVYVARLALGYKVAARRLVVLH